MKKVTKKLARMMALVTAAVLAFGSTVFAGSGDTYVSESLKNYEGLDVESSDIYEGAGKGFVVDHFHGDSVNVIMYEMIQDDVSLYGLTFYYPFYCSEGKFLSKRNGKPYEETEHEMCFKYQGLDAKQVDEVDGVPINMWQFSIKPGTYRFGISGAKDEVGYSGYVTLTQDLSIPEGEDWTITKEYVRDNMDFIVEMGNYDYVKDHTYDDVDLTVEAGDTVIIYVFHYATGDDVPDYWEFHEKLPKFQAWARDNNDEFKAAKAASQSSSETIEVTVNPSQEDPSEPVIVETQVAPKETIQPIQTPEPEAEEKKTNYGALIGGGIVLLLLLGIGIWASKKK